MGAATQHGPTFSAAVSLAPLVPSRVNNGEDCGLECGRQFTPGSDYLRQLAPVVALNLCAWLCIVLFTTNRNRLMFRRLWVLRGRFESLRSLHLLPQALTKVTPEVTTESYQKTTRV